LSRSHDKVKNLMGRAEMSDALEPVLAQFAIPPGADPDVDNLTQDPATGLLHASTSKAPLIEEMVQIAHGRETASVASVLTRMRDPADPDLVCAAPRYAHTLANALISTVTKIDGEGVDPDLLRSASFIRLVATDLQKVIPDPDLIRPLGFRPIFESD
jgi:hypothetical protein